MSDWLAAAVATWMLGMIVALLRLDSWARILIAAGAALGIIGAVLGLPAGLATSTLPFSIAGQAVTLQFAPEALWLMGFGLLPALCAVSLSTPVRERRPAWLAGAALALIGAFGVFGAQHVYAFLIAWELMSLGGAVMLLSERLSAQAGSASLFMLALLEFGAIALVLALLLLSRSADGSLNLADFAGGSHLTGALGAWIGVLLLLGFGAKLGLLPFYEWFAGAYAAGSGASGALMSGVILNAAFFALSRGLIDWLPASAEWLFALGLTVTAVGVASAILAVLYAFQQDDWRRLLSFSSAENASIAVATLGASVIFREDHQPALAGLAWTVALVHLGGHALGKGGLFLCADAVYRASGAYVIAQRGWLKQGGLMIGIGALFATMSLAALPPQIGFASEWLVFQTVFQGFHLSTLAGRLTLALAGAGLALTAAVALATFVKVMGIGLLGAQLNGHTARISFGYRLTVFCLGCAVLLAAAGLPVWLQGLDQASTLAFGSHSAQSMSDGWLLVPLTKTFAFISPSKLIIAFPLLAIVPLLLLLNARRHTIRRTGVWYGGMAQELPMAATTSLSFANATRTFYSFIYRPTLDAAREHAAVAYFIRKLEFDHSVADFFRPILFEPLRRFFWSLAGRVRKLQSGDLNFYVGLIGALLLIILALTLR
ncbi:MAG: proton-conducting transporter membrane subunit [Steroidobacteraceae bacterium]